MKILLVQPAKPEKALGGEDFSIFEPLALEYLAAGVAGDHDVRILDMRLDPDLDAVLQNYQPEVVGITAYTVHVNTVKRLFQHIKALNPEIVTVVGRPPRHHPARRFLYTFYRCHCGGRRRLSLPGSHGPAGKEPGGVGYSRGGEPEQTARW